MKQLSRARVKKQRMTMFKWSLCKRDKPTTFNKGKKDEHGMSETFRELWTLHTGMETLKRAKKKQVLGITILKETIWK